MCSASQTINTPGTFYVFAHACGTMTYWSSYCMPNLIGVQFLRRGAIAYHGAVVTSYNDGSKSSENYALRYMTDGSGKTMGEVSTWLKDEFYSYKRHYMLLGDPTLKPRFQEVTWT